MIDNNPHEFTKTLWSDKGYGDPIRILKCTNDEVEAERVATEIIERRLRYGAKFRDFAVLIAAKPSIARYRISCKATGALHKLSGGQSFFGHQRKSKGHHGLFAPFD